MTFALRKCDPTGSALAFASPGCRLVEVPTYTATPEHKRFGEARRASGLTYGEASRKLGMGTADVAGLEHGHREPVDPNDWERLRAALQESA